jgi:hypothetical protein
MALIVRVTAASDARELLGFGFPGLPRRAGEAVAIFANNARTLAALLLACLVAHGARVRPGAARGERVAMRFVTGLCDAGLLAAALWHVAFVGAALGAYGRRTVAAMLPHGPLELAAFALAFALYLAARREGLTRQRFLGVTLVSFAGLAVAAGLEVFA